MINIIFTWSTFIIEHFLFWMLETSHFLMTLMKILRSLCTYYFFTNECHQHHHHQYPLAAARYLTHLQELLQRVQYIILVWPNDSQFWITVKATTFSPMSSTSSPSGSTSSSSLSHSLMALWRTWHAFKPKSRHHWVRTVGRSENLRGNH